MKTVEYDLEIYPLSIIQKALKDYRSIAITKLSVNGNCAVVSFVSNKYDEQAVINEYNNYLIDLIGVENGI